MYLHERRLGNYGVEGLWDELRHIVLCFEAETRRLWILPNPSDPRERFLDVMGSTTLPGGKYSLIVQLCGKTTRCRRAS
jgi:hypothetical protein